MLVLSRREGEALMIGDDIVLTVLSIRPGRVQLGIDAPSGVDVRRKDTGGLPQSDATGQRRPSTERDG